MLPINLRSQRPRAKMGTDSTKSTSVAPMLRSITCEWSLAPRWPFEVLYTRSLPNHHVQTPMTVMEPHGNRVAATSALAQYILALAAETHGGRLILFPHSWPGSTWVNAPVCASVSQSQSERAQDEQRPRCHGQRLTQYIKAGGGGWWNSASAE